MHKDTSSHIFNLKDQDMEEETEKKDELDGSKKKKVVSDSSKAQHVQGFKLKGKGQVPLFIN